MYKRQVDSGNGTVNSDGYAVVQGDGDVYISAASGAATGSTVLHSVSSPDGISVLNEDTEQEVTELTIGGGTSLNLEASSVYQGMKLTSSDNAYTWSLSSDTLGTIAADGTFTAGTSNESGYITVSAGQTSTSVPVTISTENMPTATPVSYTHLIPAS